MSGQKSKVRKPSLFWRWVIGFFIVICFIIAFIQIFLHSYLNPTLQTIVKRSVKDATDELYVIDFSTLTFDIFSGTLKATDLVVYPDTARFEELQKKDSASATLFKAEIPLLLITDINLKEIWFEELFDISELRISKPALTITHYPHLKQPVDTAERFDPNTLFNKYFKTLKLANINLDELTFDYAIFTKSNNRLFRVNKVSVTMEDFFIDSAAVNNPDRLFYADNIHINIKDYTFNFPDSLYKLQVKEIDISENKRSIRMDSLQIIPQYDKYTFARKKGIETDRMAVENALFQVHGLNFNALLKQQRVRAQKIVFDGLQMDMFRDKRMPNSDSIRPPTPQQMLKNLDFYLHIDTLQITNSSIRYEEHAEDSNESGHINLNNFYTSIYNITNDSSFISQGKHMQIDARTQLMDEGVLEVHFDIPLDSPSDAYTFKGQLSATNLTAFNPMLSPVAFVKIDDGMAQSLQFEVQANDDNGKGTMQFVYDNLKIKFLNEETGKSKGLLQGIKSFVANTFVVKSKNSPEQNFREGEMYFERDKSKSIVNFWWKTLLSGLKSSVGVPDQAKKERRREKRKMENRDSNV